MKKQIISEEFKRMQKLAGVLNENEEQEDVDFLNQHKKEIFDRFNVKNNYGVSEKKFMNGYFESSGPFIFHNVEGYDDSSIEFTLLPNEERNTGMFTQTEVKIGGKKFYLTGVKNY
jgi:hypothetical protein